MDSEGRTRGRRIASILEVVTEFDAARVGITYAPIFGLKKNSLLGAEVQLQCIESAVALRSNHSMKSLPGPRKNSSRINRYVIRTILRDLQGMGFPRMQILVPFLGTNRQQIDEDIHRNSGSKWDAAVPMQIHTPAMEIEPGMKRLLRQRCHSRLDVLDKVSRIRVTKPLNNDDPPVVCLHARTTLQSLTPAVKADIRTLMGAGIQVFVRKVDEAWLLQPLHALAVDGIAGKVLGLPRCATAFRQLLRYEQNRCTAKHSLPPRRAPRVASSHYHCGRDEAYSGFSRTSRTFADRSLRVKGLLSR